MKQFGVVTINTCNFELDQLFNQDFDYSRDANVFLELYIQDSKKNLINVPVFISNFRNSENEYPNKPLDYTKSKMVRRFFITETISGVTTSGGYYQGKTPEYIRLASLVKLTVQLDSEVLETIRRPYLFVTYDEKEVALLKP